MLTIQKPEMMLVMINLNNVFRYITAEGPVSRQIDLQYLFLSFCNSLGSRKFYILVLLMSTKS